MLRNELPGVLRNGVLGVFESELLGVLWNELLGVFPAAARRTVSVQSVITVAGRAS